MSSVELLEISSPHGAALESEISVTEDSAYLRLLISIAGEARCEEAVEAICKRLLIDGRWHHKMISTFGMPLTPFYDVIKTALASQAPSACPMIERYLAIARTKRRWHEKRVLEAVLRKIHQTAQNPAPAPDRKLRGR